LLRAMGLRLDTELELTDKLAYVPVDAVTLEQAKAQALKERPDLKAQQEREANARMAASATKMERLPTVAAFGDYGAIGTGFDNALPTRTYGISGAGAGIRWRAARRAARGIGVAISRREGADQRFEGADRTGCAAGAGRARIGGAAGEGGQGRAGTVRERTGAGAAAGTTREWPSAWK
jgi:outer membrane protein TolC